MGHGDLAGATRRCFVRRRMRCDLRLQGKACLPLLPPLQGEGWGGDGVACGLEISATCRRCAPGFRPLPRPGHFLLLAQEKVTKEKGTPRVAPLGHPVQRVRGRAAGVFDGTSLCPRKRRRHPVGDPSGFSSARPPQLRGPSRSSGLPARFQSTGFPFSRAWRNFAHWYPIHTATTSATAAAAVNLTINGQTKRNQRS